MEAKPNVIEYLVENKIKILEVDSNKVFFDTLTKNFKIISS